MEGRRDRVARLDTLHSDGSGYPIEVLVGPEHILLGEPVRGLEPAGEAVHRAHDSPLARTDRGHRILERAVVELEVVRWGW